MAGDPELAGIMGGSINDGTFELKPKTAEQKALVQDLIREMRSSGTVNPDAMNDVTAVASLLRHLAEAGVIDRAQTVEVGNVRVSLGPAELPAEIAKGDPSDPRTRLKRMIHEHLNIKGGD